MPDRSQIPTWVAVLGGLGLLGGSNAGTGFVTNLAGRAQAERDRLEREVTQAEEQSDWCRDELSAVNADLRKCWKALSVCQGGER